MAYKIKLHINGTELTVKQRNDCAFVLGQLESALKDSGVDYWIEARPASNSDLRIQVGSRLSPRLTDQRHVDPVWVMGLDLRFFYVADCVKVCDWIESGKVSIAALTTLSGSSVEKYSSADQVLDDLTARKIGY